MNYSVQRQLSVAIENQPGRLAAITKVRPGGAINIKAPPVVNTVEKEMIRFVTNDPPACKTVLTQEGFYVVEADVLVFILKDTPGKLSLLCQALADAKINIDYA